MAEDRDDARVVENKDADDVKVADADDAKVADTDDAKVVETADVDDVEFVEEPVEVVEEVVVEEPKKKFKWWWLLPLLLLLIPFVWPKDKDVVEETPVVVEETVEAADDDDLTVLKVGASPAPHAEILAQIKEMLKEDGIDLQIIEFSDYVTPNTALDSGEIDANFFQHVPYLDDFNAENGTHLVSVFAVHFEPLTVYAGQSDDLDDIADGATIAVPNDTTNEARALLLLQAQGLITLKDGVGIAATPADITDNPHNIKFVEAEAAALPRLLDDADFAVINGNFALSAGIDPALALASEKADSEAADMYANVLVVKAGNENQEAIKWLVNALGSDIVREFIVSSYGGAVVPVF